MNHVKILFFQLSFFILLFPSFFLAQAPESMNYQAVIRDGSGELVNSQQVGLRIKILLGSATGSSVYEETYSPTTNAYGLVNLQLGTGSVQSGTFSTIDWGNGPYFVETAADVSGGTSYVTLSTTQFMSVPYALYAKNAGLDSAAVQAMIDAAVGSGGGGSGGKSLSFPEGINGEGVNIDLRNGASYTVPANKRLYVISSGFYGVNGLVYWVSEKNPIGIINPNSIITKWQEDFLYGLLVDVNSEVTVFMNNVIGTNTYTVPAGKKLYLITLSDISQDILNGNVYTSRGMNIPYILNEGDSFNGSSSYSNFSGYLVDEDFFESSSSGSGGSSGGGDLPIGMIIPFAGSQIPSGWLLCDGSSVSRSTYSNLYTALGNTWGSSSSTTFNLPDLRGRFLRGVDSGSGNDPDASSRTAINSGGNTGDNVGSYQNDEFKSHNHGISTSSGSGTNSVMRGGGINSGSSTSYRGGNETRPKNAYVNYIIKY